MNRSSFLRGGSSLALGLALMGWGAHAQAQQKPGDAPVEVEEVVVTGSFIKGTPEDAALPVDVIGAEELQKRGSPSTVELIKALSVSSGVLGDTMSPTKVVEYLALGIPTVANDVPDQKLVLEQSGAGLCVPMEAQPFAAAVLQLLKDPEHARQLGMRGPAYVKAHRTYDILGRNVARTYKNILME